MASQTIYTGDGTNRQFDLTFPYTETSEVSVLVNGTSVSFTFINASRVETTTAPAAGSEVVVRRTTDVSTKPVDFEDGAVLLAGELDANFDQSLRRHQELSEQVGVLESKAVVYSQAVADLADTISRVSSLEGSAVVVEPGEDPIVIPSVSGRPGKFLAFDPNGDPVVSSGTGADAGLRTDLATSGAALIGDGNGYTVASRLARVVYVEDHGGGVSKTAAENTAALLAAVAALPAAGGQIAFATQGGLYDFNPLTITKSDVTLGQGFNKPTLRFPTLGNTSGLTITGNRVHLNRLIFQGSGSESTFQGLQIVVDVRGASAASRVYGFTARHCEFKGSGRSGLYVRYAHTTTILDCDASNVAYVGLEFRSADYTTVRGGTINVLNAVGTSGNAYGLTLSHDSTNYNLDANAGTPAATEPFCNVALIDGVTVIGPKIWQAIDTHGAYNVQVQSCKTFGAGRGISLTTGSGAADQYAGWQNSAIGNLIDTRLPDGTLPSGMSIADGLTIRGPTTGTAQWSVIAALNTIRGYGQANSVSSGGINASAGNRNYIIEGNIIDDWVGAGIVFGGAGSGGAVIRGNIFGDNRNPAGDTAGAGACIALNNTVAGRIIIDGNVHNPTSGKEARWGIGGSGYGPSSPLVIVGVNDFTAATAGQTNTSTHQLMGPGFAGEVLVSGASGSITVDVSAVRRAPGIPLVVRFTGHSAGITVTDFTGAPRNARILCINDSTNTVTITRAASVLNSSGNAVLTKDDTVELIRGVSYWHSIAAPSNNG